MIVISVRPDIVLNVLFWIKSKSCGNVKNQIGLRINFA